ncbi:Hypothetical protein FKW44_015182, partial [Caligus rogercresseyi]
VARLTLACEIRSGCTAQGCRRLVQFYFGSYPKVRTVLVDSSKQRLTRDNRQESVGKTPWASSPLIYYGQTGDYGS